MREKNVLDFCCKLGIFSALRVDWALSPGVIAAHRNVEHLAEQRHCILLTVLCNKLESHPWMREKMPIAFVEVGGQRV
jgi:hypothetical protein